MQKIICPVCGKERCEEHLCKYCGGLKSIRNPTGLGCDHVYWPEGGVNKDLSWGVNQKDHRALFDRIYTTDIERHRTEGRNPLDPTDYDFIVFAMGVMNETARVKRECKIAISRTEIEHMTAYQAIANLLIRIMGVFAALNEQKEDNEDDQKNTRVS